MTKGRIITKDSEIKDILENIKTIAILGLSPKPDRDSFKVAQYLKNQGYEIIPVRPAQKEILGQKVYKSLDEIETSVDLVDAFRASDQIKGHIQELIRLKPKFFWMQLGIENHEAAEELTKVGIDVVMNRCIKVDHGNLIKKKIIV
ncbi:CoA binding protein [Desulfonema limicola]|uniref:CoA binding protein n=1 Tax=Desulfonema limicola TaxID=45656 RepID=A0A975B7W4_9BACT|nr:CoA-binding protein [Desulfonema limicola]QTA80463.1 CoA binding protein [Desulfonema limicola]